MSEGNQSPRGQGRREIVPAEPQAMPREGSISLSYPMLNKSNYSAWCIKMEIYMQAQGVWEAIVSEEAVETRRDKMALAVIYQSISEETLLQLGAKKTAKEAWENLRTMHLGAGRVKEVRAQALRWELEGLQMKETETIEDFTGKVNIIVNRLRSLGEEVLETYVVKKILRAVSPKFLQIASTIEEFGNLETKTIEEVTGSLKAHEERLRGYETRSEEQVLLVDAEIKRRGFPNHEGRLGQAHNSYDHRRGSWRGGNQFRGRGRSYGRGDRGHSSAERRPYVPDRRPQSEGNRQRFDISKIKCYACNEYGHFAADCKTETPKQREAHLVEDDDEEPALLMMETDAIVDNAEEPVLLMAVECGMVLSVDCTQETAQIEADCKKIAEKSQALSKSKSASEAIEVCDSVVNSKVQSELGEVNASMSDDSMNTHQESQDASESVCDEDGKQHRASEVTEVFDAPVSEESNDAVIVAKDRVLRTGGVLISKMDFLGVLLRMVEEEDRRRRGKEKKSRSSHSSNKDMELDVVSYSPKELCKQAVEEKNKHKFLKKEGKSEEALKAFKRGKQLEIQANALEVSLRMDQKRALSMREVAEMQNKAATKESSKSQKPPRQGVKGNDDLAVELRDLG